MSDRQYAGRQRSAGSYLTGILRAYGVQTVFGIPGVHNVELYRDLRQAEIRHVTPRHEQGAGFMADGYARATGRPGVCFTITGPGLTNIATAMAQAHADSVPMLVISSVNAHGRMGTGRGWLHELPDQQKLASGLAAFSHTVHCAAEIAPVLARAFALFEGGRPRPVHIEIPIDVLEAPVDLAAAPPLPQILPPAGAPAPVAHAAEMLDEAQAPVILAGGGAVGAAAILAQLAERLDAPIVMTVNARGMVAPDHPLGVSLSATHPATRSLIAAADVVLAIGTELGPTDYDMYEDGQFRLPGRLIRIDLDPQQIAGGPPAAIGIIGDAGTTATALLDRLASRRTGGSERAAVARTTAELAAPVTGDLRLLETVRDMLDDPVIVGDSTQLVYSGNMAFAARSPRSWFNSATGYGTLGYALPAAIGAKLGCPDRLVVALAGDGGMLFTLSELVSAVDCGAAVILLLHENGGYGEIRSYMEARGIEPVGVDLWNPDYVAIGKACGWHSERVATLADFRRAVQDAAARQAPSLIVFGDELRQAAR